MKALAKTKPEKGFDFIEAEEPRIEDDEVLVKVLYSSICGTDLHIYEWDEWARKRINIPRIIGHEMVGKVVKIGKNVKGLIEGDIVIGESHIPCLNCYYCKTGKMHICKNLKILGIDVDGCFAELCKIKFISLWKNNLNINLEYLSVLEPLGNAVHAVFEADVSNKDILIIGCGPIGLSTIYLCKKLGASLVIGVDISDYRLDLAKKFGADYVFNPKREDVVEEIKKVSEGIDVFFEMSGSQESFNKGLSLLKYDSTAIFFGLPSGMIYLDVTNQIILKETKIKGVFGRKMFETWYELENILKKFNFPFDLLITHKFKLEEINEAISIIKNGECGKVVLKI